MQKPFLVHWSYKNRLWRRLATGPSTLVSHPREQRLGSPIIPKVIASHVSGACPVLGGCASFWEEKEEMIAGAVVGPEDKASPSSRGWGRCFEWRESCLCQVSGSMRWTGKKHYRQTKRGKVCVGKGTNTQRHGLGGLTCGSGKLVLIQSHDKLFL